MSHRTGSAHGDRLPDRQIILDNRVEHAPKRHRTGKRKARHSARRIARGKLKAAQRAKNRRRVSQIIAAYYRGDVPDLSQIKEPT